MDMRTTRDEIRLPPAGSRDLRWQVAESEIGYLDAVTRMEAEIAAIRDDAASDMVWLLEHPPLYTAGTSAKASDLLDPRFPVFKTGRGGQYTYHGPGQRIGYVMLDLRRRGGDVRAFVAGLEAWVIGALATFGVRGGRREDRVGVWVRAGETEAKIAAIGVRVRRGVTYHGMSLNVAPDLGHYDGIVACGVRDYGVTSLKALGIDATIADVDAALRQSFEKVF